MDTFYGNNKIRKQCARPSKRLAQRLEDIASANNMQALKFGPGRLHALSADRKGQWAMDLEHPYRLIMEPAADPLPLSADGWLELDKIVAIKLIEIEDYHD